MKNQFKINKLMKSWWGGKAFAFALLC